MKTAWWSTPAAYSVDEVVATCWCEATTVRIPRSWVGDKTRSCGKPRCHPPEEAAA